MKRSLLIVAMLLMATPALATVTVTATHEGGGVVRVSYNCSAGEQIRAFALELGLNNGMVWQDINRASYLRGESIDPNKGYGIFPGRFRDQFTAGTPNWVDPNYMPVAPSGDPDSNGLSGNRVVLEMGALYVGDINKPAASGTLCKLLAGPNTIASAVATPSANATRGGVVDINGDPVTGVVYVPATVSFDCFPNTTGYTLQYADWVTYNKPNCWCSAPQGSGYQCDGDADGTTSGAPFYYRIYNNDLTAVTGNWKKKITDTTLNPCADIDHKSSGAPFYYRVYNLDLGKVTTNWKKKDSNLGIPGPCPKTE